MCDLFSCFPRLKIICSLKFTWFVLVSNFQSCIVFNLSFPAAMTSLILFYLLFFLACPLEWDNGNDVSMAKLCHGYIDKLWHIFLHICWLVFVRLALSWPKRVINIIAVSGKQRRNFLPLWAQECCQFFLVNFSHRKLPFPGIIKWYYSHDQTRVEQITRLLKSGAQEIGDDEGSLSPTQASNSDSKKNHVNEEVLF